MENVSFKVEDRDLKERADRLRKSGFVPAVIYSHGKTQHIKVDEKVIKKVFSKGVSESTILTLDFGNNKTEAAFVKDFQRHPVSEKLLHIDFFKVTYGEKIKTHIPFEFVGKAKGVVEGGVFEVFLHDLEIETFPRHLTPSLKVEIDNLGIGDAIHSNDIKLPPDTRILIDGNPLICHVAKAQKEAEAEPAPAAEAAKA